MPFAVDANPSSPDAPPAAIVSIKAVPGAKRDEVSGTLGDRLKVRVSQPPEGGKANRAIREMLALELGVRAGDVHLLRGESSAEKVVRIDGVRASEVLKRWA